MIDAFLLRFQEPCEETASSLSATKTQTVTKIMREQTDPDPSKLPFQTLPITVVSSGTHTITRVQSEQVDTDCYSPARMIPVNSGTKTATAVQMESSDQDPVRKEMATLPKCSSF